jgi:hypothetical protein
VSEYLSRAVMCVVESMEGIPVETAAINEICKNFVEIQGAFH